jgi:hypothetical protein
LPSAVRKVLIASLACEGQGRSLISFIVTNSGSIHFLDHGIPPFLAKSGPSIAGRRFRLLRQRKLVSALACARDAIFKARAGSPSHGLNQFPKDRIGESPSRAKMSRRGDKIPQTGSRAAAYRFKFSISTAMP